MVNMSFFQVCVCIFSFCKWLDQHCGPTASRGSLSLGFSAILCKLTHCFYLQKSLSFALPECVQVIFLNGILCALFGMTFQFLFPSLQPYVTHKYQQTTSFQMSLAIFTLSSKQRGNGPQSEGQEVKPLVLDLAHVHIQLCDPSQPLDAR